jgi:hypothetical protein
MKEMAALKEKLVREYLAVSGATAICVVQEKAGCSFRVGRNVVHMPGVVSAQWIDQAIAADVARVARRNSGRNPSKSTAERELHRAAAARNARLTTNMVVVSRATFAAKRLETCLDTMNKSGGLAEFNKEYKRRRMAATARGEGFMTFATAMMRLRRALILMLINKQQIRQAQSFFDDVFGEKRNSGTRVRI